MAALSLILSWGSALLATSLTALFLQLLGHSMMWFAHPIFILPLYAIPAFVAMVTIHWTCMV